jgi:hypothetical protein
MSQKDQKELVRESIQKADPGLLRLMDSAKARMGAKLVSYVVRENDKWVGAGVLTKTEGKP